MQFVDSDWLAAHLADGSAVAVDCRPPTEYATGHISGAVSGNPLGVAPASTPEGEERFRAYVAEYMTGLGVTGGETLVFYANTNETLDARGLWTAEFAGYPKAALLAGGLRRWVETAHPTDATPTQRPPVPFTPQWDEGTYADADLTAARVGSDDTVLLDVRSRDEYTGSPTGRYAAVNPRLGRVPGAMWMEWTELSNADGTYKSPEEIRDILAARGVTPDKEVVTYCQGGGRAAHAYAALKSAGFGRVRHYVGSFGDYSHRSELPIATDE